MPLVESVSWDVARKEDIAHRFPNLQLKLGSQVIVKENQEAVFFRDGKAYDVFGPGRHTISSANIPLFTQWLKDRKIIGDIFDCEVIYVNTAQFTSKFGGKGYSAPSGNIQYVAEISFYGYGVCKIEEAKLFVTELFANREIATISDVEEYIRGFINERVISEMKKYDLSTVTGNADEMTDKIGLKISDEALRVGIKIIDLVFEGLNIPEEARRFASGMGEKAMMMQYVKETAGELKGTEAGGAAGAGVGLGAGVILPWMMMQQAGQPGQRPEMVLCPFCQKPNQVGAKFCAHCGKSLTVEMIVCPKCQAQIEKGKKFCPECGTKLVTTKINCPKCKAEVEEGKKFCPECGAKL
ncbi:MAG: SPFH domain-containing protein [Candidatus Edwardsbacteria bacterium]